MQFLKPKCNPERLQRNQATLSYTKTNLSN